MQPEVTEPVQLLHCVNMKRLKQMLDDAVSQVHREYREAEQAGAVAPNSESAHLVVAQKSPEDAHQRWQDAWSHRSYIAMSYMVLSFMSGPVGWLQTLWARRSGPVFQARSCVKPCLLPRSSLSGCASTIHRR